MSTTLVQPVAPGTPPEQQQPAGSYVDRDGRRLVPARPGAYTDRDVLGG